MIKKEQIIGKKFNNWTIIEYSHRKPKYCFDKKIGKKRVRGYIYFYKCKCECGKEKIINIESITRGTSKSCGCKLVEFSKKNIKNAIKYRWVGHKKVKGKRTYGIWCSMKNRCYDKNSEAYKDYGGRGIKVCEEWKNNFYIFDKWAMDNGYRDDLTIDRIDVNGNYCPENCRWATRKEQARNTRRNIFIKFGEEEICLSQLSEKIGIKYHTLLRRYNVGDRGYKLARRITKLNIVGI